MSLHMTDIKIFTTGGTIDKVYYDAKSDFQIGEPQIEPILRDAGVTAQFVVEPLLRKDSLEMTDEDRAMISQAVHQDVHQRILITHGTDTMIDTALALGECGDKTIVLTGAMQPARFRVTDAIFNVGFALGVALTHEPGVYVAMNGQVFDPRKSVKNRAQGRFEQRT